VTEWAYRPVEIANLLNPAFCSVIIFETAKTYQKELDSAIPYSLTFLILPIVLHESTRERLPKSVATKMHSWIQKNSDLKIGFSERVKQMVPYTKEGLIFSFNMRVLQVNEQRHTIVAFQPAIKRPKWGSDTEAHRCVTKAALLGKLFAKAGDASTIFAMWGVQP